MLPRIAPLADLYKINTGLVTKALEDVSEQDIHKRVNDTGSSLHWIAGHIANSRKYIGSLIGTNTEFKDSDLFNGGEELKEPSAYPPISEIKKAFKNASDDLIKRLGELTEEDVSKPCPTDFPVEDKTILGGIAFMNLHESYHVGQLSYIRKQFGYKTLAG